MLRRAMMAAADSGGDPHWANVVSLLHFDGSDGSTTFVDEKGKTWSAGADAKLSTTNPKFGSACLTLDGVGDYITAGSHADFAFGTGDFTIEGWFRIEGDTGANQFLFVFGPNYGVYRSNSNGLLAVWNGSTNVTAPAGSMGIGAYEHIAMSRNGSTLRLFKGGSLLGSTSDSTNFTAAAIYLSFYPSLSRWVNGRVDDFRVTKGIARYTSNFTPPTSPFPNS